MDREILITAHGNPLISQLLEAVWLKKCPSEKFLNRLDFFAASRRIVALFNEEQRKNTTISMALQRTFFNQTAS